MRNASANWRRHSLALVGQTFAVQETFRIPKESRRRRNPPATAKAERAFFVRISACDVERLAPPTPRPATQASSHRLAQKEEPARRESEQRSGFRRNGCSTGHHSRSARLGTCKSPWYR